ncbi:MAG: gliding motility protein GldN [Cyclobacteriaceae bacterium]
MRKFGYVICLCAFLGFGSMGVSQAQEKDPGYNPNSVYPVHESYMMFKKTLWRQMDLKEKQNKPFFSRNGELPTIIINAVKQGLLFPYTNDSVTTRMNIETFLENLKYPEEGGGLTEEEIAMGFGEEEDDGFGDEEEEEEAVSDEFATADFSLVEIREDMFFDRNRSRMYYDIQAITLLLPADKNPALFIKPLASFRYKDLVELFKSMPKEAVWYNVQNAAEHRNFAEAFDLRLFASNLIKYANPEDNRIVDIYNKSRRDGILASQKLEHDMLEFENELWEF